MYILSSLTVFKGDLHVIFMWNQYETKFLKKSMIKSVLRCEFCTGNHFSVLQILPTAQRLLDELLSSQENAMNTVCGAPGMLTLNKFPNILYVQFILVSWNSGSECTFFYLYVLHIYYALYS